MKFGIYSSIANPPSGEDLPRCVDEVIEESRLAEQAGFDSCFFGEHHQDKDGFLPSPLIVCTAVAASTTRLRVGTSVILLPLHHPVRLAEDVVTLDIISKGRVTVGVGLGYQPADFQAFGIAMSDRVELFEEKVEILRNCWSGQEFSFDGKHHNIKNLRVRPDTVQTPHPPLWIGAGAPVSARRAGTLNQYQGGMCIPGVLTTTKRTPRQLISPLGPTGQPGDTYQSGRTLTFPLIFDRLWPPARYSSIHRGSCSGGITPSSPELLRRSFHLGKSKTNHKNICP